MNLSRYFAISILVSSVFFGSLSFSADSQSSNSTWGSDGVNGDFINLRASGLFLLVGGLNLDLDFKINDEWTVGPTLTYWKFDFNTTAGFVGSKLSTIYKAIGVRANWSQNGTYRTGMYLSPILQFAGATVEGVSSSTGRTITGEANAPVLSGLVGYQWFYPTGFNITAGIGLSVGASGTKAEATDGTTTVKTETSRTGGLALDFMMGYVF